MSAGLRKTIEELASSGARACLLMTCVVQGISLKRRVGVRALDVFIVMWSRCTHVRKYVCMCEYASTKDACLEPNN